MKKYFSYLFLSIMIFFISGCNNNLNFKEKNILKINFNNITILKEDYQSITPFFNKIHFSKRNRNIKFNDTFSITTKSQLYQFHFSDENILKYENNNKTYYSYNKKTIKKLHDKLKNIKKKYHNNNFFTITYLNEYQENENDHIIKIDHVNQYFKLNFNLPITELKINKVDEKEHDIDLIYHNNQINYKKTIIIRVNPLKDYYRYRITFTNKYGLTASIIPTYDIDNESGTLKYMIKYQYP